LDLGIEYVRNFKTPAGTAPVGVFNLQKLGGWYDK